MSTWPYRSAHGGLWVDRVDWQAELKRRHLSRALRRSIEQFARDGFAILEGAANLRAVDAFRREIGRSFRDGNPAVRYQRHGSGETLPLDSPADLLGTRIVDSFVAIPQALDLFLSPRLFAFLSAIFDEPPLLFQSISFEQGSQQGLHRDTAYVVVNRPMELAACWIALEDVRPGSGELVYVPGSQHDPEFLFSDRRKHWDIGRDPPDAHGDWSRHIRDHAARNPAGTQRFLARKGDILVWAADLAHGGAPITDPALTRQSLVGHFCPASARPNFFDLDAPRPTVRRYGALRYASYHYDLRDMPDHAPPTRRPLAGLKRLLTSRRRAAPDA